METRSACLSSDVAYGLQDQSCAVALTFPGRALTRESLRRELLEGRQYPADEIPAAFIEAVVLFKC